METRSRARMGFIVMLLCAGCGAQVIGGGDAADEGEGGGEPRLGPDTDAGGGSGDGVDIGGGSGTGGGPTAVSFYGAELPGGTSAMCGDQADCHDMLFVMADSDGQSCDDPFWGEHDGGASDPSARRTWAYVVGIPRALQHVGVFPLRGDDAASIVVTYGEEMVDRDTSGVVGTGGLGWGAEGELEILAIDDASIRYRVSGVTFNVSSDGEYLAPRCGASRPPAP